MNTRILIALVAFTGASSGATAQIQPDWEIVDIQAPERDGGARTPAPPPSVPDVFDEAPELTMTIVTTQIVQGQSAELEQVVSRTPNYVHIDYPGIGQAWLFRRNPIDGRRVSGKLIVVQQRCVLEHQETDLLDGNIARGWVDVVSLGINPGVIEHLVPTDEYETLADATFRKYVRAEEDALGLTELWWSDELVLPLRAAFRYGPDSVRVMQVKELERGVISAKFDDPTMRLRQFQSMDLVDWRENYHGGHIHLPGLPCNGLPASLMKARAQATSTTTQQATGQAPDRAGR